MVLLKYSKNLDYLVIQIVGILEVIFVPFIILTFLSDFVGKTTDIHPYGKYLCVCILVVHAIFSTEYVILSDTLNNQVCIKLSNNHFL